LDFVSLASALISIVLAIVTILYSFYSNSQSAGRVETLNKAAASVEKATVSYSESAESLQENISKIITAVNRVEEKTNKLLDRAPSFTVKGGSGVNNHLENCDLNDYIKAYVNLASPYGVMAIYACIRAKDENKEWNLNLLPNGIIQAYWGGFLVSAISAGFIESNINFDNGNVAVTGYIQSLKEHVLAWVDSYDYTKNDILGNLRKSIDNYFNNQQ